MLLKLLLDKQNNFCFNSEIFLKFDFKLQSDFFYISLVSSLNQICEKAKHDLSIKFVVVRPTHPISIFLIV